MNVNFNGAMGQLSRSSGTGGSLEGNSSGALKGGAGPTCCARTGAASTRPNKTTSAADSQPVRPMSQK